MLSYRGMSGRLLLPALLLALTACGARSTLSVGGDATHGPCGASPTTPAVLTTFGTFEQFRRPTAITVAGSSLYYSINDGSNDPLSIERLPTTGGAPTEVLAGVTGCATTPFGYGPLVTDGTYLYTPDEEMVTTCTGESMRITRIDPVTGEAITLPNPSDGHIRGVAGVRASAARGVFWLAPVTFQDPSPAPGTTLLVRWDGTSTSMLATIAGLAFALVVAGGQAFIQTSKILYQVPIDGSAAPSVVASVGDKFRLAGSNGEGDAIFFSPDGATIVRRDVTSGNEQILATGAGGNFDGNGDAIWTDEAWVYFVQASQNGLARVPVTGGDVEVLSPDEMRDGVNGVVTDACNVYWLAAPSFPASLPPVVYALAR